MKDGANGRHKCTRKKDSQQKLPRSWQKKKHRFKKRLDREDGRPHDGGTKGYQGKTLSIRGRDYIRKSFAQKRNSRSWAKNTVSGVTEKVDCPKNGEG